MEFHFTLKSKFRSGQGSLGSLRSEYEMVVKLIVSRPHDLTFSRQLIKQHVADA
jgi:hypothetical protein